MKQPSYHEKEAMIQKTARLLQIPFSQILETSTEKSPKGDKNWQQQHAEALRKPAELLKQLALPGSLLTSAQAASAHFSMRVPDAWLTRIQVGNPDDPLLRQILPASEELNSSDNFSTDPVGDQDARVLPGLLHKYQGRVLLMTTGACAIHCRYCFRRHYPYGDDNFLTQLPAILDYIRADSSIHEIILSGGDPLSLSNERLASLIQQIQTISHIKRLRIHTRTPIVLPARLDSGLLELLQAIKLQTVIVIHCNHPNELDEQVLETLSAMRECGLTLLNQSVLLKGVNDDVDTLVHLSERLFSAGVLAYYLHQLDRVKGAQHFEVADARAIALYAALRQRLPGYLLPKLVREQRGAGAKTPL
ncbi:Lysine 2,3-aminomutase [hydrothermal vent metagenome]|uniref:L-lysine 2,3-aminomutase n=1 Tax=hydrothermal vent metagenome TaxID=652676 RepID=A0A3B1BDJ5_9ZZZZ